MIVSPYGLSSGTTEVCANCQCFSVHKTVADQEISRQTSSGFIETYRLIKTSVKGSQPVQCGQLSVSLREDAEAVFLSYLVSSHSDTLVIFESGKTAETVLSCTDHWQTCLIDSTITIFLPCALNCFCFESFEPTGYTADETFQVERPQRCPCKLLEARPHSHRYSLTPVYSGDRFVDVFRLRKVYYPPLLGAHFLVPAKAVGPYHPSICSWFQLQHDVCRREGYVEVIPRSACTGSLFTSSI